MNVSSTWAAFRGMPWKGFLSYLCSAVSYSALMPLCSAGINIVFILSLCTFLHSTYLLCHFSSFSFYTFNQIIHLAPPPHIFTVRLSYFGSLGFLIYILFSFFVLYQIPSLSSLSLISTFLSMFLFLLFSFTSLFLAPLFPPKHWLPLQCVCVCVLA